MSNQSRKKLLTPAMSHFEEYSPSSFEKLVSRLHSILEPSGADVVWNDRIIDPDNANRTRQIDISIRRDGCLTLVECRLHKKPQDVKWIEELIGRKISLKADAIIAVSSSGFTQGALLKANSHGIITRDFLSLTDGEVARWGKASTIVNNYLHFSNATMTFYYSGKPSRIKVGKNKILELFYEVALKISSEYFDKLDNRIDINYGMHAKDLYFGTTQITYINLSSNIEKYSTTMKSAGVLAYGLSNEMAFSRDVLWENFKDFANIVHGAERNVLAIDLSKVKHPDNTIYHSTEPTTQCPKDMVFRTLVLGMPKPQLWLSFNVIYQHESKLSRIRQP